MGLPAVWNVPYARNPAFTGREDLLDTLYAARTATQPVALTQVLRGWGQVLITSRYLGWGGTARSISVQTFPRDASVRFLLDRTQQADADAATALAAEVGDLPIALAQVAAYIDATGITLAGYLSRWRTHQAELMRRGHEGLDYPSTTWGCIYGPVRSGSMRGRPWNAP